MKILRRCVVLALLVAGCGLDKLPPGKESYAGTWRNASAGVLLVITPNAHVEYKKVQGGVTTSVNAGISKFDGNDFVVWMLGINTTFHVQGPPASLGDDTFMMVDGVKLTRMSP